MTTTEASPSLIFEDARRMHSAALARTGQEPGRSPEASRRLISISDADPAVYALRLSCFNRQESLHGQCFYHQYCPIPGTERLIHETVDFIRDAEALAKE